MHNHGMQFAFNVTGRAITRTFNINIKNQSEYWRGRLPTCHVDLEIFSHDKSHRYHGFFVCDTYYAKF